MEIFIWYVLEHIQPKGVVPLQDGHFWWLFKTISGNALEVYVGGDKIVEFYSIKHLETFHHNIHLALFRGPIYRMLNLVTSFFNPISSIRRLLVKCDSWKSLYVSTFVVTYETPYRCVAFDLWENIFGRQSECNCITSNLVQKFKPI